MIHDSWLVHEHDVRLVAVAAGVCTIVALTVFTIMAHARASRERSWAWLMLAGIVSGVGVWTTHFIAMLAYDPGIPMRFDVATTALSVVIAVVVATASWLHSLRPGASSAGGSASLMAAASPPCIIPEWVRSGYLAALAIVFRWSHYLSARA